MSTGHDCRLYEKTAGKWYYDLERHTRGEYDTEGPFPTFKAAKDHLGKNHANPGGYSIDALPGCKHDLTRPTEHRSIGESTTHYCDRCGAHLDLRTETQRNSEAWKNVLERETANLILSKLAELGLSKKQEKALVTLGVPKENIDKALGRAAYWWKGIQSRLDWATTTKKIEEALKAALTDKLVTRVPNDNPGYLVFQYRAPDYNRADPSKDVISRIRQEFAVQLDWFGEKISIHSL